MPTSTVTSKGQITVPTEVRKALGLRAGSRVHFVLTDGGAYEIVAAVRNVASLKGAVSGRSKAVTLAEMDDAIVEAAGGGVIR